MDAYLAKVLKDRALGDLQVGAEYCMLEVVSCLTVHILL